MADVELVEGEVDRGGVGLQVGLIVDNQSGGSVAVGPAQHLKAGRVALELEVI